MSALPDLTIRQFEYLVAIDDADTWSEAADAVGVSPSALSQGIAELERRLGVALFERDGRRRVLRDAAAPVLAHARQVLGLTADLARWADGTRHAQLGRVRVGMIDAAAVVHFPDVIRRFRSEHPDVDVRLTVAPSGDLLEQLVGGQIDVAVVVEPPSPQPGIVTEPLREEDLVVFAPPAVRRRAPADWGPWALFPTGSHTRTVIDDALRDAGAPVDVVAESHQPEVLQEMVVLGLGWTVLPSSQVAEQSRAPRTGEALHAIRTIGTRQLVAARREAAVSDPAVDVMIDALRSHPGR